MTRHDRRKQDALRANDTLNPHPERVTDELFVALEFFDPCDLLQVKYEMLRRSVVDGQPVAEAARTFGLSRPTFYKAREGYERDGLAGLLPGKRGPRRAHKLSEEVMAFITAELSTDGELQAKELARRVQGRFGLRVHSRSVERALARAKKGGVR
jgi:transposase